MRHNRGNDPWEIRGATPEDIAALDREIEERGLADPALCCCEYSEPSSVTGSKHVSHHCCDCELLEKHLTTLMASWCMQGWGAFCSTLASKVLIPFPGGAIKVPIEGVTLGLCYWFISVWLARWGLCIWWRPVHTAIVTFLCLVFIGWLNFQLTSRWKWRSEVFTSWFLCSVIHDVRVLLKMDPTLSYSPSKYTIGLLFVSGAVMLLLLYLTRKEVSSESVRQQGAHFVHSGNGQGHIEYRVEEVPEGSGIRSKHCRLCDHRLNTYDHHCSFINACVAGRNHRYFFGFLCLAVANSSAFVYVDQVNNHYVLTNTGCYNAILSVFLLLLLIFQVILISKNLTTNEFVNRKRYVRFVGGQNPHDEGLYLNWNKFLTASRYVSGRQNTYMQNSV